VSEPIRNAPVKITSSNFIQRFVSTILLLSTFIFIILMGKFYVSLLIIVIITCIFKEIIALKQNSLKDTKLPYYYLLNWYFFGISLTFFYGKLFNGILKQYIIQNHNTIGKIIQYDNLIFFIFWLLGFIVFVLSLKRGLYRYQFQLFAWTHISIVLIVA
jgi:CDP-diglyceride synthetase